MWIFNWNKREIIAAVIVGMITVLALGLAPYAIPAVAAFYLAAPMLYPIITCAVGAFCALLAGCFTKSFCPTKVEEPEVAAIASPSNPVEQQSQRVTEPSVTQQQGYLYTQLFLQSPQTQIHVFEAERTDPLQTTTHGEAMPGILHTNAGSFRGWWTQFFGFVPDDSPPPSYAIATNRPNSTQ